MMFSRTGSEKVIDLEGIPLSDSGAPDPTLVASEGELTLSYTTNGESNNRTKVSFLGPRIHKFGLPNDETLQTHGLYSKGLKPYAVAEVLNSKWIEELANASSAHSGHDRETYAKLRHFIFAFHDSTFECIASDIRVTS